MNDIKDMSLLEGPDAEEVRRGPASMAQMSLVLTPHGLTSEIARACGKTLSGDIKADVRERLTGTEEGGYKYDGQDVGKMGEDELSKLKKTLSDGGLQFDEK